MKRWLQRVKRCWGVRVPWTRKRIELWVCFGPVGEHTHPGQHVEVMPIAGQGLFWRRAPGQDWQEPLAIRRGARWRWYSIPAGWPHFFSVFGWGMVFVNATSGPSPAENLVWTD